MRKVLALTVGCLLGCLSAGAQSMDWLCHPGEYSKIEYMGGDLFKVRTFKGKWGIMHANGDMQVSTDYDSITPFVENRALLLDKSGKRLLGLVASDGQIVKRFVDDEIYVSRYPNFKEGRLAFGRRDGLYGYMNDQGTVVVEPQYYLAAPFQDGVATVQYSSEDYGLINKAGRSVIVSNERYPFISSPVNNQVLVIKGSRKGADQLVLMKIVGTSLKKQKVLEDGMNIWLSDDFSTVECQLGHTYNLDSQWRIVSSSHNANLPAIVAEPSNVITESTTILSKVASEGGMKITYLGNPIMDYVFPDVATYSKKYAVVHSKDGKVGVLILNPSAAITITASSEPTNFSHNELKDVVLDVELVDVDPAKIKWYRNDQGWLTHSTLEQVNGKWKLRMPYFKAASTYNVIASETVDIAITYDGLDWLHQSVAVKSLHTPGYQVLLMGSDTTDDNGNAKLSLEIKTTDGSTAEGTISINGASPVAFKGDGKTIPLTVNVPEGNSKKFSYSVMISEDGCPEYSTTVTKTVHHPVKQKNDTKKDIIIR